jgi:hypothetical protein
MANVPNMRDELLGAWKLVHSKAISDDGKESFPLGPDAVGYIYYSDTGIMAVQSAAKIMELKRKAAITLHTLVATR